MNDLPLVSIIIPVYNTEKYLKKCIDSVIFQTYKNLEIICVNDCSTDGSLALLNEYARNDKRIIIIDKKNEGVSLARNSGLEIANGEYTIFVDSDDWIDEKYVEVLLKEALANNADAVMCCYKKEYDTHSSVTHIFDCGNFSYDEQEVKTKILKRLFGLTGEELSKPQDSDTLAAIWRQLVKTSICKNHRFVDLNVIGAFEDGLYQIGVYSEVKSFVYIDEPLYHYRKTNYVSITTKYKKEMYSKVQYLYDLLFERISELGLSEDYVKALNNRICLGMIGMGLNEITSKDSIFAKSRRLSQMLKSPRYKEAFKNFEYKYLPLYWKIFFLLCKYRLTFLLMIMSYCIDYLRKRV